MSFRKFVSNVWKNVKDAHEVTNDPRRWDELLEAPKRHYARSTSTTYGRIAMTALAAWGASAAVGAMGGGSAAGGAGAGEAAGTTASEGLIAGGTGTGSTGTVATANTTTGTIGQGAVMPNATGEALTAGIQQGGVSSAAGGAVGGGTVTSTSTGSGGGFWDTAKSAGQYVGNFAKENPELAAAAFQGVSSAASPDEIDLMHEQEEIRNQRLARQNQNIEGVDDVGLGFGPGSKRLRDQYGNPVFGPGSGIIQRNIGMNSPVRGKQGNRLAEEDEARLRTGAIQPKYRSY